MGKTIRFIKLFALIIMLVEVVFGIVLSILYFANLFNFRSVVNPYVLIGIVIGIIVIDSLFIWITIRRLTSLRQKTDLRAAEVIGSDIQEAYNFAMIGLAITDDENNVLWTNDLFKERHIEIMDKNIIEWKPELAVLRDTTNSEGTCKVNFGDRFYSVKLIPEAGLWIFKDIDDYEDAYNYSTQQAPVIGILAIDNYDDVVRGDDDFNDVVTKVKSDIFNYAKEFGILLRRIKDDSYSMLCNYASFSKMLEDKFSIIDKVNGISPREDSPRTLSIMENLSLSILWKEAKLHNME